MIPYPGNARTVNPWPGTVCRNWPPPSHLLFSREHERLCRVYLWVRRRVPRRPVQPVRGKSIEASSDMNGDPTRRAFLHGGAVATAGLLATETTVAGQEPHSHHEQEHAAHGSTTDYPLDRPSPGGPVGSPTDRGMLVPGLIAAGNPPVPVIVPDLPEKLSWKLLNGAKEFHLPACP